MQNFDIKVTIIQANPIQTSVFLWGFGWWWSVPADPDKLLWYVDPATNIWYDAPWWSIVANPAIVSLIPPSITGGYWIFLGTALFNVDAIGTATQGNIAFYLSWRRTEENESILLQLHIDDKNNPHETSFTNILWNARDNTDLDAELIVNDNHRADVNNPHNTTKAQVGLGNVDNTSDADKPISTATQTALDLKANNQSATSTDLTVTMTVDTLHWSYNTPLTGNLTINTTNAVRWVVCTVLHNASTVPTITGATKHVWDYEPDTVNLIQIMYDWTTAFYTISPQSA